MLLPSLAKRLAPETAKTLTCVSPVLATVHCVPLLVERNTPIEVPAKRFAPLTAREYTSVPVKPELTAAQVAPLLVERKTPPPKVPAKRFVPLTARD